MASLYNINESMLERVYPPLTREKIELFLNEHNYKENFQLPEELVLNELPPELSKLLEEVYVTKELKERTAIKARFKQYIEISSNFMDYALIESFDNTDEHSVCYIYQHKKTKKNLAIYIVEVMDKQTLNQIIKNLNDGQIKKLIGKNILFDELFLVCGRLERTFAKNLEYIELESHKMVLSFFIEFLDTNRPFEDDDLLIIDDFIFYGFNFGSLEDILSVIMSKKGKGKYIVWKEEHTGKKKNIWEGIIYPKDLLKNKK